MCGHQPMQMRVSRVGVALLLMQHACNAEAEAHEMQGWGLWEQGAGVEVEGTAIGGEGSGAVSQQSTFMCHLATAKEKQSSPITTNHASMYESGYNH